MFDFDSILKALKPGDKDSAGDQPAPSGMSNIDALMGPPKQDDDNGILKLIASMFGG